jgi:hydroxyacylglutathione hydrolase|tara:strand:- start:5748 stop:6425 length:678 start_codon:yes stop_codon:yes gene_type:complete
VIQEFFFIIIINVNKAMKIKKFTFNSFLENTYIISSGKKCMIIDPGCSNKTEQHQMDDYIKLNQLEPIELINTHCHLDHIFGNKFIAETYSLIPKMHIKDKPLLERSMDIANMYNVKLDPPPQDVKFINENDIIEIGKTKWKIIFTPGHSPGHICLFNEQQKTIIAGDVLFHLSIGRTDLPLSNHKDLIDSINNKLFRLSDNTEVFCGHGQNTNIGFEKINNPYL